MSWIHVSLAILLLHLNSYTLSFKHFITPVHHHISTSSSSKLNVSPSILNTYSVPIEAYRTPEDVGEALCRHFVEKAKIEISTKGSFYVAVPGGSAVKLLRYLKPYKDLVDWSKVFLFYVNHKCVPDNDESATHFKAKNIFIDHVGLTNVYVPDSTKPVAADVASAYASTLESVVPKKNGLPHFDLVILGMGKDGHIGSLYPGREEVNEQSALVLSVDKKNPASVTITLPVFNNAKDIRVVVTGADKAEATATAILRTKSPQDFPVCGVRTENTVWMIDEPCVGKL